MNSMPSTYEVPVTDCSHDWNLYNVGLQDVWACSICRTTLPPGLRPIGYGLKPIPRNLLELVGGL